MGTDIYRYIALTINGNVAIIQFYSGQSVGLGNLTPAFWVEALSCANKAFVYKYSSETGVPSREAACPLTQHELFRQPTGQVCLEGPHVNSMNDVKDLLKKANEVQEQLEKEQLSASSFGFTEMGDWKKGSIYFDSVSHAQTFIESVKEHMAKEEKEIDAYFPTVRDGPQRISLYDGYPDQVFHHFVESVELLTTDYECIEKEDEWAEVGVQENYWNTKAKYKIVMTSPEFLEHIQESEEWFGR